MPDGLSVSSISGRADEREQDVGERGLRFLEERADDAEQPADDREQNSENVLVRGGATGRCPSGIRWVLRFDRGRLHTLRSGASLEAGRGRGRR